MTIENMEGAIAMLEAYLSGGDELGIVPEDDAAEALNFIRGALEWMGDANSSELAAVTAERDALKAQLDAVPVKAIRYYFDNSVAIDSAPLWDYAKAEHAIKDWLEVTK